MDVTIALFFSDDSDIGFHVKLCDETALFSTIHDGMFACDPDPTSRLEVNGIVEHLQENPAIDFEDGWIAIRRGMADVTAFLMEQLLEASAEARFEDKRRFEEMLRREKAEAGYASLKAALLAALGDKADEVAAAAAA